MLSLIGGLALISGQIVPASQAVAALSKDMGVPIEISAPLKNDLIFIEPRNASPSRVLSALVEALHASVRRTNDRIEIRRTSEDHSNFERIRTGERKEWLDKRLKVISDYRQSQNSEGPDSVLNAARFNAQRLIDSSKGLAPAPDGRSAVELLPEQRLLDELVDRIGADQIAALKSGETCTWESNPSQYALPLPLDHDLLSAYKAQIGLFENVVLSRQDLSNLKLNHIRKHALNWKNAQNLSLVKIVENSYDNGIALHLEGFDSAGSAVTEADLYAGPSDFYRDSNRMLEARKDVPGRGWVDASPDATAIRSVQLDRTKATMPMWLASIGNIEPLNLLAKEALEGVAAENPNRPLVIAVSDRIEPCVVASILESRLNVETFKSQLDFFIPYQKKIDDEVEVWSLQDPEFHEREAASRKALALFTKQTLPSVKPDIRSVCSMFHRVSEEPSTLAEAVLQIIQSSSHTFEVVRNSLHDPAAFQLLGSIPDDAWDRLLAGQTLGYEGAGISDELERFILQKQQLTTEGKVSDFFSHPAELLPRGESSDANVRMISTNTQMIEAKLLNGQKVWETFSDYQRDISIQPKDLVWEGLTPKIKITQEEYENRISRDKVRLALRPDLQFRIGLKGGLSTGFIVYGPVGPPGDPITYADFPKEFRDSAWAAACATAIARAIHDRDLMMNRNSAPAEHSPVIAPPGP